MPRQISLQAAIGACLSSLLLLPAVSTSSASAGDSPPPLPASPRVDPTPWPLRDALGREAPMAGEAPAPREGRFVGIFYFLWHNNRGGASPEGGPYDIARILARDPDALHKGESPLWGPRGLYHYWGEPLHGYYRGDDPWVLRRHARLLADAGIDTLIFDTTNAVTYPEIYTALCEVFTSIREAGGRTPAIAFMVNTQAGRTAQRIYEDLYKPGRYRDLWFLWEGKPLMICDPAEAGPEVQAFFTLRKAHWPFTQVNTPDAWHWEAAYPQVYGYTDDPEVPEQVNVSVAQNLRVEDGKVTNMSDGNARGRSFHGGVRDTSPGAVDRGGNFQEQWERALELDPPFVMVTGWNEWIAGRFGEPGEPSKFVDQYDREYSRDIEPMKGGHGDNYYAQLVANVRRYKGVPEVPVPSAPKSIDLDGGFSQWEDVAPEFTDDPEDAIPRDHDGAAGTHYVNRSGRNDLVLMKVAHDEKQASFYVRTREPIASGAAPGGMWLLLDTDQDPTTGWEGYDFIVNRSFDEDGGTWLEAHDSGWTWTKAARVQSRVEGHELHLSIPRAALGLPEGASSLALDFKWADNLQQPGEIMDVYLSGDVAPESRFRFRFDSRD